MCGEWGHGLSNLGAPLAELSHTGQRWWRCNQLLPALSACLHRLHLPPQDPGQMMLSLGTSGTLFGVTEAPLLDPTGAVCPFCDATGRGLPLMCTLNCTMPPHEVWREVGRVHVCA